MTPDPELMIPFTASKAAKSRVDFSNAAKSRRTVPRLSPAGLFQGCYCWGCWGCWTSWFFFMLTSAFLHDLLYGAVRTLSNWKSWVQTFREILCFWYYKVEIVLTRLCLKWGSWCEGWILIEPTCPRILPSHSLNFPCIIEGLTNCDCLIIGDIQYRAFHVECDSWSTPMQELNCFVAWRKLAGRNCCEEYILLA